MLGPNGDSNGCVSIKEYEKFLKRSQTVTSSASSLCSLSDEKSACIVNLTLMT